MRSLPRKRTSTTWSSAYTVCTTHTHTWTKLFNKVSNYFIGKVNLQRAKFGVRVWSMENEFVRTRFVLFQKQFSFFHNFCFSKCYRQVVLSIHSMFFFVHFCFHFFLSLTHLVTLSLSHLIIVQTLLRSWSLSNWNWRFKRICNTKYKSSVIWFG